MYLVKRAHTSSRLKYIYKSPNKTHLFEKGMQAYRATQVTLCAGHISANSRPHQLFWGDREMVTGISCKRGSHKCTLEPSELNSNSKTISILYCNSISVCAKLFLTRPAPCKWWSPVPASQTPRSCWSCHQERLGTLHCSTSVPPVEAPVDWAHLPQVPHMCWRGCRLPLFQLWVKRCRLMGYM